MKILAVCGFGLGSSMVLKMTLEKVARKLGIEAEFENTDVSSAKGIQADVIFTSFELTQELAKNTNVPIYSIRKYMDMEEVEMVFKQFINQ